MDDDCAGIRVMLVFRGTKVSPLLLKWSLTN